MSTCEYVSASAGMSWICTVTSLSSVLPPYSRTIFSWYLVVVMATQEKGTFIGSYTRQMASGNLKQVDRWLVYHTAWGDLM